MTLRRQVSVSISVAESAWIHQRAKHLISYKTLTTDKPLFRRKRGVVITKQTIYVANKAVGLATEAKLLAAVEGESLLTTPPKINASVLLKKDRNYSQV